MGARILRIFASIILFVVCYVVFLYWVFPYNALKDRFIAAVERQLGGGVTVTAKRFEPYWVSGVDIGGLSIEGTGPNGPVELASIKRLRARASMLALLVGSRSVHFRVEIGKGEIDGSMRLSEDQLALDADLDNVDLGALPFLAAAMGLKLASKIDGSVSLAIDLAQPVRSSGTVDLRLDELKILASQLDLGGATLPLPDLDLAKGRESQIKLSVGKGTATLDSFKFANGDLALDLKGKIFLSNKLENYRLNVSGSFAASQKLVEALPFLFIVDAQKQEDGSYPLSITGRMAKPSIKVGTFTVPL